ncbi:MAG: hypothetical protein NE330_03220 [Lentisphaeraceae bacterium]|nr:hypothetical protein [Lentisphaeraceae bacterium]
MLSFLAKKSRLLSLSFLCLFFLSANHYGNYLIAEGMSLAFNLVVDDYKCKDHGCGCTSALKCLTDCCCVVPEDKGFETVKLPDGLFESDEVESCCSEKTACAVDEEEMPLGQALLNSSSCSAEQYFSLQISKGILLDIFFVAKYDKEIYKESEWISKVHFVSQSINEPLLKVPILV